MHYKWVLKGMVNRVSTSRVAQLALLAGSFAVVSPLAMAGDKIEFSPAPEALAVPQSQRSVRQDTAATIRETLSKHHVEASDFNGTASGTYVTIVLPAATSAKSHDHFGWTAPFEQPQEQESDSSADLLSDKKSSPSTHTNSWSTSSTDTSSSKEGSWTKDAAWSQADPGLARFSVEEALKSSDLGEGWASRHFDRHSPGEEWSRGFGSHESKDPVRSGYEGYTQTKEDFGAFYNQPFGASSQSDQGGGDDAARIPGASSKSSLSDWSTEGLRDRSEQQLPMQPSIAEMFDQLPQLPTAAHPFMRSSSRDQTISAPHQSPSAPVNLPFPQRPGSLFQ